MDLRMNRRRVLKTLFCSSVFSGLNVGVKALGQAAPAAGTLDLLALGDFGSGDAAQKAVGRTMARYAAALGKAPDGLLLLGDNFYGAMPGGVKSPRWQSGFSAIYPAKDFPGPCWPILGNHDYHDTVGNELAQLGYAASLNRATRWTFPAKYYRLDLPAENPQITLLMLDTNWQTINAAIHKDRPCWMAEEERLAQMKWLEEQLASKRAPFTVVAGHHPVYSDAAHGDTKELVRDLAPLLEKHGVHVYICGHDHDLQHMEFANHRTSFVLSGGGGARIYPTPETLRPGSSVFGVNGFSHLSLAGELMTIRHIDANGNMLHAFTKGVNYDWKVG
jgi:3',5'-cyclic AMP phosphodiesterase CpdA